MTSAREIVENATEPLPVVPPSTNGGPPRESLTVPLATLAAAFVLGVVLARFIAWRAHAHPR